MGDQRRRIEELTSRARLEERRAGRSALRRERHVRPIFADFEFREAPTGTGGTDFVFRGYASVFNAEYSITDRFGDYVESVDRGAFTATLRAKADVVFVVGHQTNGVPLARTSNATLRLAEDSVGLHAEARLDGERSDCRIVGRAVERGDLAGLSMAFQCRQDAWNTEMTRRRLVECSLDGGDISIVAHPASTATIGSASIDMGSYKAPALAAASASRPLCRRTPDRLAEARVRIALLRGNG